MKKITYIIQDCAHCNLIDFDGTRYFCTHPKMKRIAVIPMVKDAIHSDCPLEDDLPESKGSTELPKSDGWIPVSERLSEGGENVMLTNGHYTGEGYITIQGKYYMFKLRSEFQATHWQPLPAVPQDRKGEK